MTERTQVSEIVADYKMGTVNLDDAAEKIAAVLGFNGEHEQGIVAQILEDNVNDPLDMIVAEIDAEYELDFDDAYDGYDDYDDESYAFEEAEQGGEA